jgi:hypothetical protein
LLQGICLIVFSSSLHQVTGGKEENTIRHMPSNKQLEVKRKTQ